MPRLKRSLISVRLAYPSSGPMRSETHLWLMDMDGVLVHEDRAVPGADSFVAALREHEVPFLVLTDTLDVHAAGPLGAAATDRSECARGRDLDLGRSRRRVSSSSSAPGGSAFVIGEARYHDRALRGGLHARPIVDPDYVILGETRTYSFERITVRSASSAVARASSPPTRPHGSRARTVRCRRRARSRPG